MSKTQNTPCGCRCNNADGTREPRKPHSLGLGISYSPLSAAAVEKYAAELSGYLTLLDREIVRSALISESMSEFLNREREEVQRGRDFPYVVVPVVLELNGFGKRGLAVVDGREDCFFAAGDHCSSPVVAESEAGTSDAPAMTVQEGGSSDAAPGVEGVSPASSTPRFVAVGEYVYDRTHSLIAGGWPSAVATKWARDLNADVNVAGYMEWEDAK